MMQKWILAASLLSAGWPAAAPVGAQQIGASTDSDVENDDTSIRESGPLPNRATVPESEPLPDRRTVPVLPPSDAPDTLQQLLGGNIFPLKLQLKDLNTQWRRFTVSGQFEMGDITKMYSSMFGGTGNDAYYTRGITVRVSGEIYLVAYQAQLKGGGFNLLQMMQSSTPSGTSGGSATPPAPEKLTGNTALALTLLNLRTVGSLKEIRPFNLQQEISSADASKGLLGETFEKAQGNARNASSNSNLKQIGLGLLMYTQDYDEVLPPMKDLATAKKVLMPYIKSEQVFVSPNPGQKYQTNPIVSSKKLAHMTDPASMAVMYEDKPAPDKTRGVLFLDGHVKRVSEADWPTVKKASKLP